MNFQAHPVRQALLISFNNPVHFFIFLYQENRIVKVPFIDVNITVIMFQANPGTFVSLSLIDFAKDRISFFSIIIILLTANSTTLPPFFKMLIHRLQSSYSNHLFHQNLSARIKVFSSEISWWQTNNSKLSNSQNHNWALFAIFSYPQTIGFLRKPV